MLQIADSKLISSVRVDSSHRRFLYQFHRNQLRSAKLGDGHRHYHRAAERR